MKEATRNEYSGIILQLIYFREKIEETWSHPDLKGYDRLLEILKFYYQFAVND